MSDPHAPAPHDHPAGPALPFTADDWRAFHRDDVVAGRAVVVLMTAIFSIGVALYTVVMIAVLMK